LFFFKASLTKVTRDILNSISKLYYFNDNINIIGGFVIYR